LNPDPDPDLAFEGERLRILGFLFFVIYLQLGLLKGRQSYKEKPSAFKRTISSASRNEITTFFYFLWVIFALLGPDPRDPIESGSISKISTPESTG
jgi:hypothetical protein